MRVTTFLAEGEIKTHGQQIFELNSISRAIIDIEIKICYMSIASSACCVVVLNQQQEQNQNICYQNQCQDVAVNYSKSMVKSCTVVENGRVVVKPLQPPLNQTSE
ncbi:MAG: hypothetical protein ACYTXA_31590 [Nostoc sp.]